MDSGANTDSQRPPQRIEVLGVPVDAVNMESAKSHVLGMLAGNKVQSILALNPEKVMAAQRDTLLLQTLHNAALVIPDGIGVVMAARLLKRTTMERVPGSELMPEICGLAASHGYRVFLYGARPEVVVRTAYLLQERYPGLRVVGTQHGYVPEQEMDQLISTINDSGADVLFVGLGSPRQELWMERHRHRLRIKVCQGVGGTFDAICGNVRRAPPLMRRIHLEWLYRLVSQPRRAMRQSALPRFASQVLRQIIAGKRQGAEDSSPATKQ